MLVMAAMLVTVFVVPTATLTLTLILNVGITALLLTTLIPLAGEAINLHIDNRVRGLLSKNIAKATDGNQTK